MKVSVSPEHARLSHKANVQIAFVVWCILRDNIRESKASGHYNKNDVKSLCDELGYTNRHWTRIFNSGDGIFWGNDDKMIHIRSMKRVTKRLEVAANSRVDVREHFHVSITIEITENDKAQSIYAKLYWAWFVARGEVEISRDEIQSIFGLSHDQQRAYERLLDKKMIIRSNYCLIDLESYQDNPQALPKHARTIEFERLTASDKVVSVKAIQYQLPNSYLATSAGNGESATTTAPQSQIRANAARLWYAKYPHKQNQLYFANISEFERFGKQQSYVRVYFQGKKRLWKQGHYF